MDVIAILLLIFLLVLVLVAIGWIILRFLNALLWLLGEARETVDSGPAPVRMSVVGTPSAEPPPGSDDPVRLPVAARSSPRSVAVTAHAAPDAPDRVCPYCKDAIAERSVRVECASCATWHHATCFEENGGCSVFGCREQRGRGVAGVRAGA